MDKLVLEEYIKEFERILKGIELDVLYMRIFDNMSYKAIEKNLGLGEREAINIFIKSRRKLLTKSSYIKKQYLYHMNANSNIYNNPLNIVINRDIG